MRPGCLYKQWRRPLEVLGPGELRRPSLPSSTSLSRRLRLIREGVRLALAGSGMPVTARDRCHQCNEEDYSSHKHTDSTIVVREKLRAYLDSDRVIGSGPCRSNNNEHECRYCH